MISSRQAQMEVEAETESKDIDRVPTERETEDINVVSPKTETQNKDRIPTKTSTIDIHMDSIETETEDKANVPVETKTKGKETLTTEVDCKDAISTEIEIKVEDTKMNGTKEITRNKDMLKAIVQRRWQEVESTLKEDKAAAIEPINSDGNTVLHIAVGTLGRNYIVSEILSLIKDSQLPKMINLDGSTPLHIAAIVGNTQGAMLLIKKNASLLEIQDRKGETPLDKAYENMHLDTIEYLLKAAKDYGKTKKKSSLEDSVNPGAKVGVNLLVNAVSAKQYDLATQMIEKFPEFAVENDKVLMAIARTFPSGLDYAETLIYPIMGNKHHTIVTIIRDWVELLVLYCKSFVEVIQGIPYEYSNIVYLLSMTMLGGPLMIFVCIFYMILLLVWMVYFPFFTFYLLLWKVSARLFAPIKHIEKKKREWEESKEVLKLVCDKIDKLEFPDAHPRYYTGPILEAARQNAYEVVDEILMRSPGSIKYKDKNGYDIIQSAVIHRSEKIYNLIYIIGERRSVYRLIEDSSENNMLHLAGRLAPSHKLKHITGAALQLQRELQWREEVEKLVFPSYITKENIFMETPDMVFTKEHYAYSNQQRDRVDSSEVEASS
ncbi:hypothetical protein L2E82_38977 [Cichorium intybus]|uniref:Uncharacterized protein n=1 Tax=Cichorium intybus TaxID=13427 RepID=A0ACB9AIM6_CICIN|nr:hypothetical protein L2E82_38977 [Cichorium intybus]